MAKQKWITMRVTDGDHATIRRRATDAGHRTVGGWIYQILYPYLRPTVSAEQKPKTEAVPLRPTVGAEK